MRRPFRIALAASALIASALIASAVPAGAHPRLVSASPAANAAVTRPTQITLTFSEALVAPLSGIELTMTAMPGMANHPRMPIRGFTTKAEGRTLTATPAPPPCRWAHMKLKWHVVAADQHRIENLYTFNVR